MRTEHDALGSRELPADTLYGIHTLRAAENFPVSPYRLAPPLIRALAQVKLACARTNARLGYLDNRLAEAIETACLEIIGGSHQDSFITDPFQGGAGTSANMNMNEVVANRACQLLGGVPRQHSLVSPLNHVNMHQSTNDVFPTALRVAMLHELTALEKETAALQAQLQQLEAAHQDTLRLGRTQLQDAVPMTFGMTFGAWAEAVARDRWRVFKSRERIRQVSLGGTAIGTGLGAPRDYILKAADTLRSVTGLKLSRAENLVDATQNTDQLVEVSAILKALAANLLKISTDLRLLGSGPCAGLGELKLPAMQAGSTIMPGKVNPVIAEAVSQAALRVLANDGLAAHASAMGTLELNQFMPLLAHTLLESLHLMRSSVTLLNNRCMQGLEPQAEQAQSHVGRSAALAAVLVPLAGHTAVEQMLHTARTTGTPFARVAAQALCVPEDNIRSLLAPERMRKLGFTPQDLPQQCSGRTGHTVPDKALPDESNNGE
jgi:aspartate ammonia-lyase